MKPIIVRGLVVAAALLTMVSAVDADEGMWLFNHPPLKHLKDRYRFSPDQKWLDHVRLSSVRFNSGGSGSFVSADGLVMTNHHVGADTLQKISTAEKNYMRDGFYAKTRAEEVKALDLELNVLQSIEDVTARVNAAVKPNMPSAEAFAARRKVTADIEKESLEKTGLRSNVITLYQGAEYHLYRFKKYTDVRLVFAPEQQIAFYGGDPDNFEYPRYDLDICFFRVYENDKPAKIEHYLTWSKSGCDDGELVFVSGHPGNTDRLNTVAELEYLRDRQYPYTLQRLNRLEVLLSAYSARSDENARRAREDLFSIQNSRKARNGGLAGLMDPAIMGKKKTDETALRDACAKDPKLKEYAGAWDTIAKAVARQKELALEYNLIEGGRGRPAAFNSHLFQIARTLLRGGDERLKPNGDRLQEYRDSNLESLQFQLFSEEPIYDDLEQLEFADSLTYLAEALGYDNPTTQLVLAGKSPHERARELIQGSKLKDVAVRKKLYEGGEKAIDASQDP
ncbi:MAG TPA: S46 family peptidase, partial [Gemmataceae bacterium]|nr:S46 family peptidase [Gemmataceae bacterium]